MAYKSDLDPSQKQALHAALDQQEEAARNARQTGEYLKFAMIGQEELVEQRGEDGTLQKSIADFDRDGAERAKDLAVMEVAQLQERIGDKENGWLDKEQALAEALLKRVRDAQGSAADSLGGGEAGYAEAVQSAEQAVENITVAKTAFEAARAEHEAQVTQALEAFKQQEDAAKVTGLTGDELAKFLESATQARDAAMNSSHQVYRDTLAGTVGSLLETAETRHLALAQFELAEAERNPDSKASDIDHARVRVAMHQRLANTEESVTEQLQAAGGYLEEVEKGKQARLMQRTDDLALFVDHLKISVIDEHYDTKIRDAESRFADEEVTNLKLEQEKLGDKLGKIGERLGDQLRETLAQVEKDDSRTEAEKQEIRIAALRDATSYEGRSPDRFMSDFLASHAPEMAPVSIKERAQAAGINARDIATLKLTEEGLIAQLKGDGAREVHLASNEEALDKGIDVEGMGKNVRILVDKHAGVDAETQLVVHNTEKHNMYVGGTNGGKSPSARDMVEIAQAVGNVRSAAGGDLNLDDQAQMTAMQLDKSALMKEHWNNLSSKQRMEILQKTRGGKGNYYAQMDVTQLAQEVRMMRALETNETIEREAGIAAAEQAGKDRLAQLYPGKSEKDIADIYAQLQGINSGQVYGGMDPNEVLVRNLGGPKQVGGASPEQAGRGRTS